MYMFITGLSPSIIRATLFFILININNLLNLRIKTINLFLILLSSALLINPYSIYNNGFLFSYTISFYLILFGFALFGLGDGLGNLSVIKNCWLYFPNNKALVNGIILGAYGLNSATLNPLADLVFINPNKKETDDDGYYPPDVANNLLNSSFKFIYALFSLIIILVGFFNKSLRLILFGPFKLSINN